MQQLHVYTSDLAYVKLTDLLVDLTRHLSLNVVVRPLDKLPLPQPERLNALLLEQQELSQALACAEWCLERLASGQWQPDAALENGCLADRDALASRLRAVSQSIELLKRGGQPC